jgi:hypothetical protein
MGGDTHGRHHAERGSGHCCGLDEGIPLDRIDAALRFVLGL